MSHLSDLIHLANLARTIQVSEDYRVELLDGLADKAAASSDCGTYDEMSDRFNIERESDLATLTRMVIEATYRSTPPVRPVSGSLPRRPGTIETDSDNVRWMSVADGNWYRC